MSKLRHPINPPVIVPEDARRLSKHLVSASPSQRWRNCQVENESASLGSLLTMAANREVNFSNPQKVYFPNGFTKGAMVAYYIAIARTMLPHVKGRPITLIRFPDGVKGESFYEKNKPAHAPDWVK